MACAAVDRQTPVAWCAKVLGQPGAGWGLEGEQQLVQVLVLEGLLQRLQTDQWKTLRVVVGRCLLQALPWDWLLVELQ